MRNCANCADRGWGFRYSAAHLIWKSCRSSSRSSSNNIRHQTLGHTRWHNNKLNYPSWYFGGAATGWLEWLLLAMPRTSRANALRIPNNPSHQVTRTDKNKTIEPTETFSVGSIGMALLFFFVLLPNLTFKIYRRRTWRESRTPEEEEEEGQTTQLTKRAAPISLQVKVLHQFPWRCYRDRERV